MPASPFRRPAMLSDERAALLPGEPDPAERNDLAHTTATALVSGGRAGADDADLQRRLVHLVDVEGLDLLAQLWSASPAETLPGALWRLYLLREWTRRDPHTIAERYRLGCSRAEVSEVVAGVVSPPGPQEVRDLTDAVLHGVFGGDLDVALDRAAAFLHVLVAGTALDADWVEDADAGGADRLTRRAGALQSTAEDLQQAAALWRAGKLD
ncbi:hypothetical protein [Ruania albidiflava]|uniref:hypothetical protein n=1 Tax=Ruania albidiflava TaxID=366586 RepID=UPI0003F896EA|nr:hypothetical protein [Ruania albidiflava]